MDVPITIKDDSQKLVLRLIRKHQTISGAELARLSNLQPSTMVYILRKLQKLHLIEKAGIGESTEKGGKRPVLWKIKAKRFYILGAEMLPTKSRFVISDINGNIIQRSEQKFDKRSTGKVVINSISTIFKEMAGQVKQPNIQILGAGVAVPGLVDSMEGRMLYSASLEVNNYDVIGQLDDMFEFPVFIANDANAAALTIPWYNGEKDENSPENFVYLLYTQGAENLGSGLFINGNLFQGYYGTAGEIFTPMPRLRDWMLEGLNQGYRPSNPETSRIRDTEIPQVVQQASLGCPLNIFVIHQLMTFIAEEIIRIVGFINPEAIILGGDLVKPEWLIKNYLEPFLKKKSEHLQALGYQLPTISYSQHGKYSVALGATALVLNEFM